MSKHELTSPHVDERPPEPIDPAHRDAVAAGLADMRAGRIASKEEIEAVYARFSSMRHHAQDRLFDD
ncbi:protein of unknown function [Beijerinckiaceae bacterium RH CH11]|nr:hypothetical protein [Beijerinckiaceae bacterium]VVB47923.1 protein of unknown function [Beijerinckiaceae bacterium RH CH11]VVB48000.1 protein of unknown function [Beijerinckiaceae bacterium RH AL8]